MTKIHLARAQFDDKERLLLEAGGVEVSLFRYPTGVEAVRLANPRGYVIVLPYLGQMVWDASFEGVRLTMGSMFAAPRPATHIADTYGCYAYHSGLLRNGNPGPQDTHQQHGEMPCAPLESAHLQLGADGAVTLGGVYEYIRGFGAHYRARPSVTLRPADTRFDIAMQVQNLGGAAMDLMYMCHINPAFVEDGHIVQPAPWTPEHVTVRATRPAHVPATPHFLALLDELAREPGRLETVDPALAYDPELVFYLHRLRTDAAGQTHVLVRRPEGDGFATSWKPAELPHTVRWLMRNADIQVTAYALPATCEPEGYLAERAKGNVRSLAPGESASFGVTTGYLDAAAAAAMQARIEGLAGG